MKWELITREQYVTTRWSGGTTTQLAIAPEGAVYADRDFLWRTRSTPPWSPACKKTFISPGENFLPGRGTTS